MDEPNSMEFMQRITPEEEQKLFKCRICHEEEKIHKKLCTPCKCRGDMAYVHKTCIVSWMLFSGSSTCSVCTKNICMHITAKHISPSAKIAVSARYLLYLATEGGKKACKALLAGSKELALWYASGWLAFRVLVWSKALKEHEHAWTHTGPGVLLGTGCLAGFVLRKTVRSCAVLLYLLVFRSRKIKQNKQEWEDVEFSEDEVEYTTASYPEEMYATLSTVSTLGIFAKYREVEETLVRRKPIDSTEACEIFKVLVFEEDAPVFRSISFEHVRGILYRKLRKASPLLWRCLRTPPGKALSEVLAALVLAACISVPGLVLPALIAEDVESVLAETLSALFWSACAVQKACSALGISIPALSHTPLEESTSVLEKVRSVCLQDTGTRLTVWARRVCLGMCTVLGALHTQRKGCVYRKTRVLTSQKLWNTVYVLFKVWLQVLLDRIGVSAAAGWIALSIGMHTLRMFYSLTLPLPLSFPLPCTSSPSPSLPLSLLHLPGLWRACACLCTGHYLRQMVESAAELCISETYRPGLSCWGLAHPVHTAERSARESWHSFFRGACSALCKASCFVLLVCAPLRLLQSISKTVDARMRAPFQVDLSTPLLFVEAFCIHAGVLVLLFPAAKQSFCTHVLHRVARAEKKLSSALGLGSLLHDAKISASDMKDLGRFAYLPAKQSIFYRDSEIACRRALRVTEPEVVFYFTQEGYKHTLLPSVRFIDAEVPDGMWSDRVLYSSREELLYSPSYSLYYVPLHVRSRLAVYFVSLFLACVAGSACFLCAGAAVSTLLSLLASRLGCRLYAGMLCVSPLLQACVCAGLLGVLCTLRPGPKGTAWTECLPSVHSALKTSFLLGWAVSVLIPYLANQVPGLGEAFLRMGVRLGVPGCERFLEGSHSARASKLVYAASLFFTAVSSRRTVLVCFLAAGSFVFLGASLLEKLLLGRVSSTEHVLLKPCFLLVPLASVYCALCLRVLFRFIRGIPSQAMLKYRLGKVDVVPYGKAKKDLLRKI
ncbi:hypothetical protein NECID01_0433 [Nematocida sp. AWRm77]|nr:hypothetical protein NECID01_0433 [Nematocida sp. AWRm77]